MKTKILSLIILVLTLVSCIPLATLAPTETTIPPTLVSPTLIVTPEFTATLVPLQNTATPTESAMPISWCEVSVLASPTLRKLTSETHLITLLYPENWECDNTGDSLKYTGIDGFFLIYPGYTPAESAKIVCETQAKQSVGKGQNLYGANPTVEELQVDDQPACLVLPSDNQRGVSLLVIKYPFEYPEMGKNSTRVLMLRADKNHIRDFIRSLKFIR